MPHSEPSDGEAGLLWSPKVTLVKCLRGSFGEEPWDSKEKLQTCFPKLNWRLGKDSCPGQ